MNCDGIIAITVKDLCCIIATHNNNRMYVATYLYLLACHVIMIIVGIVTLEK